jgi:hypothetical protein
MSQAIPVIVSPDAPAIRSHDVPTQEQLIKDINEFLWQHERRPTGIHAFVKRKYHLSKKRKFASFGYGKLSNFINEHKDELCLDRHNSARSKISEQDLINEARLSYQRYGDLSYALDDIRRKYGVGAFNKYGFGTFKEFRERNFNQIYVSNKASKDDKSGDELLELVRQSVKDEALKQPSDFQ